jgi:hemerythrin-like domain-containing protein
MKATQVLRDEHEGILAMLAVVQAAAYRLREGASVPPDLMTNAVGFFQNFADKCHHHKEEGELFPLLLQHGIPRDGGPIGVMLEEHEQGRTLVRRMKDAADKFAIGDVSAKVELVLSALEYVRLLREHIDKENGVLFPMADSLLSESEQDEMSDSFERIEADEMGPGVHERYHAMIGEYQKLSVGWK